MPETGKLGRGREQVGEERKSKSDKMGSGGWEDILMVMFWRLLDSGLTVQLNLQIKILLVIRV